MTIYYIDPTFTGGGNNGSLTNPWTSWGSVTPWAAGNIYLQKRGTTSSEGQILPNANGTSVNYIRLGSYYNADGSDDPTLPRPIIKGTSGDNVLLLSAAEYFRIENLEFDGSSARNQCIQMLGTVTRGCNNITIYNCSVHDCLISGINMVVTTLLTDPTNHDIIIDNCQAYNCGYFGIAASYVNDGITIRNCRVWDCCTIGNGWGIWAQAANNEYSGASGWTNPSGTIYTRALLNSPIWCCRVINVTPLGNTYWLVENTSTPTTPSSGQYGVSNGDLYINIGGAITSYTITVGYRRCMNIIIENCETWNCYGDANQDGYGMGLDDLSEGIVRNCYSHDNKGTGIAFNSYSAQGYNNISVNNGLYGSNNDGFLISYVSSLDFYNNVALLNPQNGVKVLGNNSVGAIVLKNNIAANNGSAGIWYQDMANQAYVNPILTNGSTAQYNCLYGNALDNAGHDSTSISSDPLLDSNYFPAWTSPCLNAGSVTLSQFDAYGRPHTGTGNHIGAVWPKINTVKTRREF